MNDGTATAVSAPRRWLVQTERADLAIPLRDYFRRLGFDAEVNGPALVAVTTHDESAVIEAYVSSWASQNGTPLRVEGTREEPHAIAAPAPRSGAPRLGTLLINKGYLTPKQLSAALDEASATGDLLGVVLLRTQLIFEDELARTLSEQLSIPYIGIGRVGVNPHVARMLPPEVGAAAAAIPVRGMGNGSVQVAFADPTDSWALSEVGRYLPSIEIAVAELSDIRLAWRTAGVSS